MSDELIIVENERKENDLPTPLLYLAEEVTSGRISIPVFQRGNAWDKKKKVAFLATVISGKAIGVVVTYQTKEDTRVYLADGLQRISAAIEFLENPMQFGFSFGAEQAKLYCRSFPITVQHRIYKDHTEAMRGFQNLNQGTSLTPAEYYKGELTLTRWGKYIYDEVPLVMLKAEHLIVEEANSKNRIGSHKYLRGALALFLQFTSETTRIGFWLYNSGKLNDGCVERALYDYYSSNGNSEIKSDVEKFSAFIDSHYANLREIIKSIGCENKYLGLGLSRALLHANIYRRNKKSISLEDYNNMAIKVLSRVKDYQKLQSKIIFAETNPPISLTIKSDTLGSLVTVCRIMQIPFFDKKRNTPDKKAPPGYHVSHVKPFSKHGEGETFIEPALLNLARGAKDVATTPAD